MFTVAFHCSCWVSRSMEQLVFSEVYSEPGQIEPLSFHLTPGSRCWLQREPHPARVDVLVSSSLLSKGAKTPLVPTTTNPAGGGPDQPTTQQEQTELVVSPLKSPGSQSGIRWPQRHSLPSKMTFRRPFVIPNRSRGDTDISELYSTEGGFPGQLGRPNCQNSLASWMN